MGKCFLEGYGECGSKMTGEHYISRNLLERIGNGKAVAIGGLPFQPDSTLQQIGIGSLEANILCDKHNPGLAPLDAEVGRIFDILHGIDKTPKEVPALSEVNGDQIERWLLKLVCGLVAGPKLKGGPVQDKWKELLMGGAWPEGWGLYVVPPGGPQIFVGDFYFENLIREDNGIVGQANIYLAGVQFALTLGKPGNPAAVGFHRPPGLVFRIPEGERKVELRWCGRPRSNAVLYTKVGTTNDGPAHRDGWKESSDPKKRGGKKKRR